MCVISVLCDIDPMVPESLEEKMSQVDGESAMEATFFGEMSFWTWVLGHQESSSERISSSLSSELGPWL